METTLASVPYLAVLAYLNLPASTETNLYAHMEYVTWCLRSGYKRIFLRIKTITKLQA